MDLYSALRIIASNTLPLPVSRRWSPQANPTARHSANTARPRIRAGVSRDMPVYSPSLRRVIIPAWAGSGWVGLSAWLRADVVCIRCLKSKVTIGGGAAVSIFHKQIRFQLLPGMGEILSWVDRSEAGSLFKPAIRRHQATCHADEFLSTCLHPTSEGLRSKLACINDGTESRNDLNMSLVSLKSRRRQSGSNAV